MKKEKPPDMEKTGGFQEGRKIDYMADVERKNLPEVYIK